MYAIQAEIQCHRGCFIEYKHDSLLPKPLFILIPGKLPTTSTHSATGGHHYHNGHNDA